VPYTVNKAQLVEQIANVVIARKLPQLLDVKDRRPRTCASPSR
jgi:DNA gyrase/topoisomerase IV subunit A